MTTGAASVHAPCVGRRQSTPLDPDGQCEAASASRRSQTFLSGPTGFRFRQARFAADEHRPVIRDRRRIHNAGAARLAYELEAHHPVFFEACNMNSA